MPYFWRQFLPLSPQLTESVDVDQSLWNVCKTARETSKSKHRNFSLLVSVCPSEDAMGGRKKEEGGQPHKGDPSQTGFGPPFVWYVCHPPLAAFPRFSCTKIQVSAHQELFFGTVQVFDVLYFFVFWSPSLAADNHPAWVGLINRLAARNLVLNFPSFCRIYTEKTFKFNKRPRFVNSLGVRFVNHPACSL